VEDILLEVHIPFAAAGSNHLVASAAARNTRLRSGDEGLDIDLGRVVRFAGRERRCIPLIAGLGRACGRVVGRRFGIRLVLSLRRRVVRRRGGRIFATF